MSYSLHKLKLLVEDPCGTLQSNLDVAKRFCSAETDGELKELCELASPEFHFSNFWGVVRGHTAALAVVKREESVLRLTWTSRVAVLTANTFERRGYVHFTSGGVASIPLVGSWLTKFWQQPVRESLVVRDGKVVFRDLSFQWGLGVH
ncbi:hypothetical protein ERJ75_000271500 [Trypanosoma vivax]|uniref:NTF2-like domain-containing protein n=1 Tax=Trypanosoma vivax (strain Y486) TaxID=1055687 RepID=G0U5F9_TRYVY|nr:hypothetical protein TRVL_09103 [Trypanosoma vivax]KAH8618420.1 hypothetical protein ERJ75_000271500 [Trypanosoma vivax]CCC51109.1 conserved hypothetical protein [Trypanosoma vivax Y486]